MMVALLCINLLNLYKSLGFNPNSNRVCLFFDWMWAEVSSQAHLAVSIFVTRWSIESCYMQIPKIYSNAICLFSTPGFKIYSCAFYTHIHRGYNGLHGEVAAFEQYYHKNALKLSSHVVDLILQFSNFVVFILFHL